ncbi:MAG: two-component system histidine kinase PnpS [Thermodesulfobacteriota bacterium]
MKLQFRGKLGLSIILLILSFFLVQTYLIYSFNKSFLFSSLLSFLVLLPLSYWVLKFMTRPIQAVTNLANRIASGRLDQGVSGSSDDEMGRLSKAINEMSLQLQNKIEEISREKDYLRTLLNGIMEGVLVVDVRGRILTVNDALRQLLSLPPDVEDRTPLEIIRNAQLEGTLRQVLQGGGHKTLELTLPSPHGKTFEVNVVSISSSPDKVGREEGGHKGVIAVFHDITRLKELENIRRDFVANVSHELRTPLTTIKGYTETLLDGALREEIASQFIRIIKKHSDRLEKIVEDLLTLSKIESREFQLKTESLSLYELIGDVLDFIREPLHKKNITLSVGEIPPSLLVYGDRQYLEQVLMNILDNAIKYGRDGGAITISAIERDHKEVEISVKDDGIGIPKEDLSRVFERFYRVDKGRSHELGGTGLGLSIVKHIVQAHGGRVWVESQPGEGSTFYFTLPLRSSPLSP